MKFSLKALSMVALVSILAVASQAAPTKCPVCHMALATKKSKDNPVAVKLTKGGKTFYCCAKCKMPAAVIVKGK